MGEYLSKFTMMENKILRSFEKKTRTVLTKRQVEEFHNELVDIDISKMAKLMHNLRIKLKKTKYKDLDPVVIELLMKCIELDDPVMREGSSLPRHITIAKLGMIKNWSSYDRSSFRTIPEIAEFF